MLRHIIYILEIYALNFIGLYRLLDSVEWALMLNQFTVDLIDFFLHLDD